VHGVLEATNLLDLVVAIDAIGIGDNVVTMDAKIRLEESPSRRVSEQERLRASVNTFTSSMTAREVV